MKKFLAVLLLLTALISSKSYACIAEQTINFYMYKVLDTKASAHLFDDFWRAYVGPEMSEYAIDGLLLIDPEELKQSFETGEANNDIVRAVIAKKDKAMQDYLLDLITYHCLNSNFYNAWEYPSEDEIAARRAKLTQLRTKAEGYNGALKERYNLMAMRCMFQLEKYADVEKFWTSTGSKTSDKDIRQTMLSLFAGALYRQKKMESALQIFAQLGDIQSLKFCLNDKRNYQGIKEIYEKDHDNTSLPFMIQDYVNMTQETLDGESGLPHPSDFYEVKNSEAKQFADFANKVADTKATNAPCMWKTAAAMIHYLLGDYAAAQKEIAVAVNLGGTQLMKDNARAIQFLVYTKNRKYTAAEATKYMTEIKWLQSMADKESHFSRAAQRIIYQNIQGANKESNKNFTLLIVSAADMLHLNFFSDNILYDMTGAETESFYNYAFNNKKLDAFEKYLLNIIQTSKGRTFGGKDFYLDQVGTKYLSEHNLAKAEQWLSKVSIDFMRKKGIAPFMVLRNYNVEPWYNAQEVTYQQEFSDEIPGRLNENQRLKFAKDLALAETQYNNASGEKRMELAYNLAVMCIQASQHGNCWYLTHDGWSLYGVETRSNEFDYEKRAMELLQEASESKDNEVKSNALFGLLWIPRQSLSHWNEEEFKNKDINSALEQIAVFIENVGSTDAMENCDVIMDYIRGQVGGDY